MKKIMYVLIIMVIISGCSVNKKTDAIIFKEEYEKYNDTKEKLEIDKDNIIKYADSDKINNIINKDSGVIFIGNARDNASRITTKLLLEAADSTDLDIIYYSNKLEDINIDKDNKRIPIVIYVLEGKIINYVINDKDKLTEDLELELYNKYLDGIHEVLQDTCDERC